MKVVIVSGIWPPDVGGPASHAPELADFLHRRGHRVHVVTTADSAPAQRPYPVDWMPRRYPPGVRHFFGAGLVHRAARDADVVYSTGMLGRSAFGSMRKPLVVRLAGDPAYERALRRGLTKAPLDVFQREHGARVLRRVRDFELRRAARIVVPSQALADVVRGWGFAADVIPHAVSAPALPDVARQGLVFAGRLVPQKALSVAFEAVRRNPDVTLTVAGDGPERAKVEALAPPNVCFVGAQPREKVFELLHAADATLLSSDWESFSLVAAESLAVGTPVIAAAAGGVGEVVEHERNGLLVPPGELADAIQRYFADPELRERLRARAPESVRRLAPNEIYPRYEALLEEVAKSSGAF
jgi:glycosyltransferase involved in cell wall biosynthesis